jgi:phosphatidylserine/phosphatidylglycerophosphate/cardiolipin synthase-like enzyme
MSEATMEICLFTITNNTLRDAIQRAHDRGVAVRIISDDECLKMMGSDVYRLKGYGIPARSDSNPNAHMHNKFVVIDNKLLITGSFNWTVQAVKKN